MTKPIPLHLQGAYLDHNGNLVDHLVHHNQEYGDKILIAKRIAALFRSPATNNTHYPVNMGSRRYPENTREDIRQFYNDDGVDVTVRGKTRIDLVPGEESGKVYDYTISFPFRYLIYNYCMMYGDATKKDLSAFQAYTKKELREALAMASKPDETVISHDIYMMFSNGMVVNIGS